MKISNVTCIASKTCIPGKKQNKSCLNTYFDKVIASDTFAKGKIVSFGNFNQVNGLSGVKSVKGAKSPVKNSYRAALAEALSKYSGRVVAEDDLACVMDKKEFIETVANLSESNYVYNDENVKNGVYRADLHSHSNFSDGLGDVQILLLQAADYGDKLFAKTHQKFIFALTDHDGVEGVKKALECIAQEPERYKNIRFVPGAELSYVHRSDKSKNPAESSELLTYCLNPFAENTNKLINHLYQKRQNLITGFIAKLSDMFPDTKFSMDEFTENYMSQFPKDLFSANLHWRVYHYGQTKLAVSNLAREQMKNPEEMYKEIMAKATKGKSLGNLRYLSLIPSDTPENEQIIKVRKKIEPQMLPNGEVVALSENTPEDLFDAFKDDSEVVMGFAHPAYFSERTYNPDKLIQQIVAKSKGLIKTTESYHQGYFTVMDKSVIGLINSYCEGQHLIPIGGRDSHNFNLF